ncbi:MAG TPA: energy transducer TonB [Vicinamibacteria bacterium]
MAAAPAVPPSLVTRATPVVARLGPPPRFQALVLSGPRRKGRGARVLVASTIIHALFVGVVLLVPLLSDEVLPEPGQVVRAFFVQPSELAPPPPPPPPPAAGVRPAPRAPAAPRPAEPARFVAPIDVPAEVRPEEGLDIGVEGGVPGGVEGGVPGGVVGGIIGGLPTAPPPVKVVRVGGHIRPPKLVRNVAPVYPELARMARVSGIVILEAHVGVDGYVKSARILRSIPLLDDAALTAVKQWRYQPLLLNGAPTEFLVNVTVVFHFNSKP